MNFAPTKITNQDNFIYITEGTINRNSNSAPDEWGDLKKNCLVILLGILYRSVVFRYMILCKPKAPTVIDFLYDNQRIPVRLLGGKQPLHWFLGLADIVTLRTTCHTCFWGVQPWAPKQTNWVRGIRYGLQGVGHVVACDTCRSCQDQEEHVGLMTGQRWSGKPDPFPWGGLVYCGFLFRGTEHT